MQTLVQRLRDADGPSDGGDALAPLCHQAADEIERLHRTLEDERVRIIKLAIITLT